MSVQDLGISLDTVWMLLAAMLVFFMQPGFALCEAGAKVYSSVSFKADSPSKTVTIQFRKGNFEAGKHR